MPRKPPRVPADNVENRRKSRVALDAEAKAALQRTPKPGAEAERLKKADRKNRKMVKLGRRMTMLANGEIDIETLDTEELVRGRMRDKNGGFTGRPPTMVPAAFHNACVRELLRRGDEIFRGAYLNSIEVFVKIANDPTVEAGDRLKAAMYVIERIAGKVPAKVEVSGEMDFTATVAGVVATEAEAKTILGIED